MTLTEEIFSVVEKDKIQCTMCKGVGKFYCGGIMGTCQKCKGEKEIVKPVEEIQEEKKDEPIIEERQDEGRQGEGEVLETHPLSSEAVAKSSYGFKKKRGRPSKV